MVGGERACVREKVADIQAMTGDFDKALGNYEAVNDSVDDNVVKARTLRKMADVYENRGDFDTTLDKLAEAKEILMDEGSVEYGRILYEESTV